MDNQHYVSGAFGNYKVGSMGEVLNTLVEHYHVPLTVAEIVLVGDSTISYMGTRIATFSSAKDSEHSEIEFTHRNFTRFNQCKS